MSISAGAPHSSGIWEIDRAAVLFANTSVREVRVDAATPLYRKLYRVVYNARLSGREMASFTRRRSAISSFNPRIFRPCSSRCGWVSYTDAATNPPRICDRQSDGMYGRPVLELKMSSPVPAAWISHFKSTCLIFGSELLALVAFLE